MKGKIMLVVQILIQGLNVKSLRGFFLDLQRDPTFKYAAQIVFDTF